MSVFYIISRTMQELAGIQRPGEKSRSFVIQYEEPNKCFSPKQIQEKSYCFVLSISLYQGIRVYIRCL